MRILAAEEIREKVLLLLDSEQRQIFLALLRCLIPDAERMQVRLDFRRLKDEFLLMKYYGQPMNNRSLIAAGAPVIFINRDKSVILEELALLFIQMRGQAPGPGEKIALNLLTDILTGTEPKESLIVYNPPAKDRRELIEFQKAKVALLLQAGRREWEEILIDLLYTSAELVQSERKLLQQLTRKREREIESELRNGNSREERGEQSEKILRYFSNIRNFRISRALYQDRTDPLVLIRLEEGETTLLPPLGKVKLIRKELTGEVLSIEVRGKTESYLFRYRRSSH